MKILSWWITWYIPDSPHPMENGASERWLNSPDTKLVGILLSKNEIYTQQWNFVLPEVIYGCT